MTWFGAWRILATREVQQELKHISAIAKQLAKRNTILTSELDRARQTIEHLRRVEVAYQQTVGPSAAATERSLVEHPEQAWSRVASIDDFSGYR